jgi:hypothetical protein
MAHWQLLGHRTGKQLLEKDTSPPDGRILNKEIRETQDTVPLSGSCAATEEHNRICAATFNSNSWGNPDFCFPTPPKNSRTVAAHSRPLARMKLKAEIVEGYSDPLEPKAVFAF